MIKMKHRAETEMLKEWLVSTVRLPQYYNVLVENGYDRLDIVKEIDTECLKDIGINLKEHQTKLIAEIKRLGFQHDEGQIIDDVSADKSYTQR